MQKNDKIPGIQKILNKLISEEYIASMTYDGCITSVNSEERQIICDLFQSISDDERNDHHKNLVNWAISNGYNVPFKIKELEKYAESDVKMLNDLKVGMNGLFYVEKMLESETNAIKSYEEALGNDNIPYELHSIILRNYYDELEHAHDL